MTSLLEETLRERADRLDVPQPDIEAIVRAGDRRVARRRTAWLGGAVAAVAATALVLPTLSDDARDTGSDRPTSRFAAAFAANDPTYAVGRTVYVDGRTFHLTEPVRAFVQTDAGVVYADPDGVVRASDGERETELGRLTFRRGDRALAADGSLAAWVEAGETPRLAVVDQRTGEVTRTDLQPGSLSPEIDIPARVAAVDDGAVYVQDDRGLSVWREGRFEIVLPGAEGRRMQLDDVQSGVLAWRDDSGSYRVGRRLSDPVTVRAYGIGTLSPDGSRLAVEVTDGDPGLFDTGTGRRLPEPDTGYAFQLAYGWVDADTYVAVGIPNVNERGTAPDGGWTMDLLTCSVPTSSCETAPTKLQPASDGSAIPIGMDWSDG